MPLTSLVGREREATAIAELLRENRLVTVTGPGGVGKTRLAVEVARAVAAQFPDGAFFVGLGTVADPSRVAGEVASALGVRGTQGGSVPQVLAEVLAPQRLLLVLDNCEHVLDAVAKLCGGLLNAADDVRILATSREQLWVGGEARYRLSPLGLPKTDEPAEIGRSEAVTLFAERARYAAPDFVINPEDAPLAARVAARLDGMPLAIELAAARVEALGLAGLADRIDDALRLLTGKDALAADRHRSLVAVADWSYHLLSNPEQVVFQRLAAFHGPFTLEAAAAVAGPDAEPVVLRLVDCSLLVPPQPGLDGRVRYTMLQTLRTYGLDRLAEAGEEAVTAVAVARFAQTVAARAAADLEAGGHHQQLDALRLLDAEDATLSGALDWALEHDPGAALVLGTALAPWWLQRGRLTEGYSRMAAAVERVSPGGEAWASAQLWLGYLASYLGNHADSLAHHASACAAAAGNPHVTIHGLAGQALEHANLGNAEEATRHACRALTMARDSGHRAGVTHALTVLSLIAYYTVNEQDALAWGRQAQESLAADTPAHIARMCRAVLAAVLSDFGDQDAARGICADAVARSRETGDLLSLSTMLATSAHLEYLAANVPVARTYLHEAVHVAAKIGDHSSLTDDINECGNLSAATGRWAEALTLWAAHRADLARTGLSELLSPEEEGRRREYLRRIESALNRDQVRAAEERGARMTLAAAAGFVTMLTAPRENAAAEAGRQLSTRERELVTLVAQGHTNAQIAERLHISVRTVASHLDRIRDKTGHRRRADLTRLALEEGLV
jgi:predicted ATPase/DNA-binding CsgD family transcriptional regulator